MGGGGWGEGGGALGSLPTNKKTSSYVDVVKLINLKIK